MRHWFVLAAVYALIAALIVPGPLGAQEEAPDTTAAPAEPVAAEEAPAEAAPVETVPSEPAPAPAEPAPAEPAPAEAAPVEPAPVPAEPVPAAEQAPAVEPAAEAEPARKRAKKKRVAVAAATQNVTIVDFEFTPATITVQQGDTVTWTNEGPTAHSATASDGSFDTGIFSAGGSRSHTFNEAGSFAYICTPHPNMTGTVVVEASSSGGSGGEGSGSTDTSSTDSGSTTSGTGSGSTSSGSGLPATGADALLLAIIGVLMLAIGIALQRRSGTAEGGAAGRIGW